MISPGPATRVFLALGATDMRKGFEGLAGLVRAQLGEEPLSGHLFVFSNAARTRVKILFWDGSGLWVCGKRLERGRFCWPTLEQGKGVHHVVHVLALQKALEYGESGGVFLNWHQIKTGRESWKILDLPLAAGGLEALGGRDFKQVADR